MTIRPISAMEKDAPKRPQPRRNRPATASGTFDSASDLVSRLPADVPEDLSSDDFQRSSKMNSEDMLPPSSGRNRKKGGQNIGNKKEAKEALRKAYLARASFIPTKICINLTRVSNEQERHNLELASKKQVGTTNKLLDPNNPKTWQGQPSWGWRTYVEKEEIVFDEKTKRVKHCQLWKVPIPKINHVRELIKNNMPVKPQLYYTIFGKSYTTYGERTFYCPACDSQFDTVDQYHKHVAQKRWEKTLNDEKAKRKAEEELKKEQRLQIQKFLREEERERKRTIASLKSHQRDSKLKEHYRPSKIDELEEDNERPKSSRLSRIPSQVGNRMTQTGRPSTSHLDRRITRQDSRVAVRQSYMQRVMNNSQERLAETAMVQEMEQTRSQLNQNRSQEESSPEPSPEPSDHMLISLGGVHFD